ncbi:MAG: hypothetical protein JNM17_11740 [Archangium sp.]|nr:hypothetical protein [Archangium sp.]
MRSWLFAFGAALALAGCRLVDLSQVTAFGCAEGGRCPDGKVCCADSMCRADCSGVTGGGSGGGGGAMGGGNGGGGAMGGGSGGGGGGATICDATTCPNGCCDGTTCVMNQIASQCGRAGQACQQCPSGESCVDGACEGCLQTCTTGCCTGSTCAQRSQNTCGLSNSVCSACGIQSDGCSADGQCQCGTSAPCAYGQRCNNGTCVCDDTSCPDGCCTTNGVCLRANQQSGQQCGLNGVACGGCDMPPTATCTSATDRRAYRAPGSCTAGMCQYAEVPIVCAFGCNNGLCENDVCQGCLIPPPSVCVGNVRRTYQSPGTCGTNGCTYTQVDTTCSFGCNAGVCNPDPCAGVLCEQPPAARCNGSMRLSYANLGSCTLGSCSYAETQTQCQFGCDAATGNCNNDPCGSVVCNTPPVATCNGSVRRSYFSPGACSAGSCSYTPQDVTCASGCNAGQCLGDPCENVTCTMPPAPICLNGMTRRTYASMGTCALGSCNYMATDNACPFGCSNGSCITDPCSGVTCNTPPGPTCQGNLRRTFMTMGACTGGTCSYVPTDTLCNTAPAPTCQNANTLRTFAATGSCSAGVCNYAPTDTACPTGCANGMCNADPCAGVTCTTPPAATCVDATTRRAFGSPGTCAGMGMCSYPSQDTACNAPPASTCLNPTTMRTYSAAGMCSNGTCNYTPTDTPCSNGCSNGACTGDPCAGVTCNMPPGPTCANGTTRRTFAATGTCGGGMCSYAPTDTACNTPPPTFCVTGTTLRTYTSAGTCTSGACGYSSNDTSCPFGCANGACNPDPCQGVSCGSAPGPDCPNSTTRRTYTAPGTCSGGTCSYPSSTMTCNTPPGPTCNGANTIRTFSASGTCSSGTCNYPPQDTPCNAPPAPICVSGSSRTYASMGTCNDGQGTCTYAPTDTACQFGCTNGLCDGDPCLGVSCNSPPASACDDANYLRIYSTPGTCNGSSGTAVCTYGSSTSYCANGCSGGACLPCNASTCANGCCRNGSCIPSDISCRTGGGTCPTLYCSGGRMCCDGVCLCPEVCVRAGDPQSLTSRIDEPDDEFLICP